MNIQQAVSATRIHHQWMADELQHESYGLSPDTVAALEAKGHKVMLRGVAGYDPLPQGMRVIGVADSVGIDPKTRRSLGAADARARDGAAVAQ
jgi:gamma-glutamyltranspeptidase / glutathione hydrolase